MTKDDKFYFFQLRAKWNSAIQPRMIEGVVTGGGPSVVVGRCAELSYRNDEMFREPRESFEARVSSTPAAAFAKAIRDLEDKLSKLIVKHAAVQEDLLLTIQAQERSIADAVDPR